MQNAESSANTNVDNILQAIAIIEGIKMKHRKAAIPLDDAVRAILEHRKAPMRWDSPVPGITHIPIGNETNRLISSQV